MICNQAYPPHNCLCSVAKHKKALTKINSFFNHSMIKTKHQTNKKYVLLNVESKKIQKYFKLQTSMAKMIIMILFPKHTKQPLCIRGVFNIIIRCVFSSQQQQRKLLTLFFTQTQQMK